MSELGAAVDGVAEAVAAPAEAAATTAASKRSPQENLDRFWQRLKTDYKGLPWTILPDNLVAKRASSIYPKGLIPGQSVAASYEQAAEACKAKVDAIIKECKRVNRRYRDVHFDIDMYTDRSRFCLDGLLIENEELQPKGFARVGQIFDKPQFFIDGADANDIKQGALGDCWFLAAVTAVATRPELLQKVCVAQNINVGVYGFVFHRDGEWISTVIDDQLYLHMPDYNNDSEERNMWESTRLLIDAEEEYRKVFQTGSKALYFAQCRDENEIWLPLLEKAFAKVHGDFSAIDGGQTSEGIEDLTGGVTSEFYAPDVLDDEAFWGELLRADKEFLFGCHAGSKSHSRRGERFGIHEGHAYTILKAVEIDGKRLVKVRNPWGTSEWTGAWSDGSAEWTGEWMQKLDHKFGDDGIFWISYEDIKRKYQLFSRTRIFGPEWTTTMQWTHVEVPWTVDYSATRFQFTLSEATACVLELSQLDSRYFKGFEGQYRYELQFRVHKEDEDDFIVRSSSRYCSDRSVSTELDLEAGTYTLLMKITAIRYLSLSTVEELVRNNYLTQREKLLQIGLSYDLAFAKAQYKPTKNESAKTSEPETSQRAQESKVEPETAKADAPAAKEAEKEPELAKEETAESAAAEKAVEEQKTLGASQGDEAGDKQEEGTTKRFVVTVEESKAPEVEAKPADPEPEEVEFPDDMTKNPWNAVCVVGLRVLTEKGKATIKVIRDEARSSLDVDDSAVDTAKEKEVEKLEEQKKEKEKPAAVEKTETAEKAEIAAPAETVEKPEFEGKSESTSEPEIVEKPETEEAATT